MQSPCAPRNVQNLTSNRDFCTPEVLLKSSFCSRNSLGKVDLKILLSGFIIHSPDSKHTVKELQTLKWLITNEDKAVDLDDLHEGIKKISCAG